MGDLWAFTAAKASLFFGRNGVKDQDIAISQGKRFNG
jgi:hypothetical protein